MRTTIDSVIKNITKSVAQLRKLQSAHHQSATEAAEQADLHRNIEAHEKSESERAARIAEKLENLVS